jgi:two-component system response regulator DevR
VNEPLERLSPREQEVLALIAEGRGNKAIATALHLRPSTVKGYVERILKTLGVANRTEAAAYWFQHQFNPHGDGDPGEWPRPNASDANDAMGGGQRAE